MKLNWATLGVLSMLGALSVSSSVFALDVDRAGSWFVSPLFGYYSMGTSRNLNDSVTGGVQAGYNFTNLWAAQVGLNYFHPDDKTTGQSYNAYFAHVDGVFNFPTHARVSPYAAVGLGDLKITKTKFAVDYGAGLEIFPTNTFSFSGNFRHIVQFSPSEGDNLVYFAVNFYFGNGDIVHPVVLPTPKDNADIQKFREESRYELPDGFPPCKTPAQVGCIRLSGNQMTMNLDVKYANDKSLILNAYQPQLNSLGQFLKAYPKINLAINGYTSNTGTYRHNQILSDHRAESVKAYLIKNFNIAADRLSTKGWSWNNPVATNKTAEGQAENRRVEAVAAVPLKPTVVRVPVSSGGETDEEDVNNS